MSDNKAKGAEPPPKKRAVNEKRTGGGTLIGGTSDPRARAASGLMPVAGLDIGLEDAKGFTSSAGVTATVASLAKLLQGGDPNLADWVPHRPSRPEKSEGGVAIRMVTEFKPSGDQPTAIRDLVEGLGESPSSAGASAPASVHAPRLDASAGAATEGGSNPENQQGNSPAAEEAAGRSDRPIGAVSEANWREMWEMAVVAVTSEPVSGQVFPDLRENTA